MSIPDSTREQDGRRAEDPGQPAPDRRDGEKWARMQFLDVPGPSGDRIGEVNPDPWTSLDVGYHYWPGEPGKVDLVVFGENEDEEILREVTTVHLSADDARQLAAQLQEGANALETAKA